MSDDAELMVRVQAGDEAALGTLMERWEMPVKGLLRRLVQNGAEADDLAQETFVRVWEQRARYRVGAAFRPWMFAIAVNLARNRLRWWRRRPEVTLEAWSGGDDGAASGAMAAEARERAEAVRRAVAELPTDLREALVLAEYEGMPQAEIALTAGVSVKAVESRLYRARGILRTKLASWTQRAGA
ncbi:RNA polymerase sigma factor [Horticoccus luteus]|uniref:RNA polymerase sigma factor n=1 Tax=Horticoccus luteus TaxID=2862869 RepID=A0A8F9XGH7_9BACT|nr:RNA polymerase sigma factor [Horticoccus luteus]QYM78235.1 RNA polymerase sigma factor [Horticoccus luteus]